MKSIKVRYVPSVWRALWLYPEMRGSLFNAIQTWDWLTPEEAAKYE